MTETRNESVTWLTQEAYDRLKAEFDYLSVQGRIDIAKKIEAARDEGDLRENGGYHAAKEEQGKQEGRILRLQYILENARVGEPPRTDGVVGPGMTVTVRFVRDDEEVTFLLAVGVLLAAAWCIAGWVGVVRGAKSCVILATDAEDPDLAACFRLAYLKMVKFQARRREASGPIGTIPVVPVTPALDATPSDEILSHLEYLVNENGGRISTIIFGRFMQPRYRLSIGKLKQQFQTHLVVSLEAKGKVVEVWNERIAVADLFDADCRLLREIVASVDGYVTAYNR